MILNMTEEDDFRKRIEAIAFEKFKDCTREELEAMVSIVDSIDKGQWALSAARSQMDFYRDYRHLPGLKEPINFLNVAEDNVNYAAGLGKDVSAYRSELAYLRTLK